MCVCLMDITKKRIPRWEARCKADNHAAGDSQYGVRIDERSVTFGAKPLGKMADFPKVSVLPKFLILSAKRTP